MRRLISAALMATALAACSNNDVAPTEAAAPTYSSEQYMQAITDIARPESDRQQDDMRQPGALLAFAKIDKGEKVGDYIMGGGYITRLLAIAVGSGGKVFAFQPEEFIAFRPEYAKEQAAAVAPYENVVPVRSSITSPGFPEPLDTIITAMNLHDLYINAMPPNTAEMAIAGLFDALKPGGTLVVIDHNAADGSGTTTTDATHRMEKQFAIDALTSAGFELEEESDLYANPDDPRTANVFDETIRGKTDKFAIRLRKPATAGAIAE